MSSSMRETTSEMIPFCSHFPSVVNLFDTNKGVESVDTSAHVNEGASNKENCLEEVDETTFYFPDSDIPKTTSSAGWSSV